MTTETEHANEELVNRFCRDWSRRDAGLLATYFADPFEYMVYEGGPVITSRDEFIRQMGPFLARLKSVEWEVVRSEVLGPLVINERIDHFHTEDGKHDHHPRIAGFFVIRNGKISVWRDYNMTP